MATKGTITAIQVQITSCDKACREWRNLRRRSRRNGYGLLKQVLVDAIKEQIRGNGKLRRNYEAALEVELKDCGGKASYKTWDDIPDESVPCPCGNPNHWLIQYKDLRKVNGGS